MRLPHVQITVRRMMAAVAVVALVQWAVARCEPAWMCYLAGWWNAERELWRGAATFDSDDGRELLRDNSSCIELATGLPVYCHTGCVVREGDVARARGHNDHIRQYIRWHGLPGNTIKPWEREVFDLKRSFAQQSRQQAPTRLAVGGPAVVAPDGECLLRPVAGRCSNLFDLGPALKVVVSRGNGEATEWLIGPDTEAVDLLWGPAGSQLVLFRSRSEGRESYSAFDLRGGILRTESWVDGKTEDDGWEHLLAVTGRESSEGPAAPVR